MAHFAELDSNNVVLRVIVVSNEDVDANGGDQSTGAEDFVPTIVPHSENGVAWKQTSYNSNFRKQYAGPGYTFDSSKNKFIAIKPFPSWTLDSNDDWQAPVTYPNSEEISGNPVIIIWDEDNQRWKGKTYVDGDPVVETDYIWDASGLAWNEV